MVFQESRSSLHLSPVSGQNLLQLLLYILGNLVTDASDSYAGIWETNKIFLHLCSQFKNA